jgi:hypothetical protein
VNAGHDDRRRKKAALKATVKAEYTGTENSDGNTFNK